MNNNKLQIIIRMCMFFCIEHYIFGCQEPLRTSTSSPWKLFSSQQHNTTEQSDTQSHCSSRSGSPCNYNALKDQQAQQTLKYLFIPNEQETTHEFKKLKKELHIPSQSMFTCIFGCGRKK